MSLRDVLRKLFMGAVHFEINEKYVSFPKLVVWIVPCFILSVICYCKGCTETYIWCMLPAAIGLVTVFGYFTIRPLTEDEFFNNTNNNNNG